MDYCKTSELIKCVNQVVKDIEDKEYCCKCRKKEEG